MDYLLAVIGQEVVEPLDGDTKDSFFFYKNRNFVKIIDFDFDKLLKG